MLKFVGTVFVEVAFIGVVFAGIVSVKAVFVGAVFFTSMIPLHVITESVIILAQYLPFLLVHVLGFQTYFFLTHDVSQIFAFTMTFIDITLLL